MLSLLGGDDDVGDFGEVCSDHIRTFDEGVEGLPGDEGSGAPCAQSPRNVPGVGRDEAHPTFGDLQRPRGHPVGSWRRFEAFRRVGGEDLLEPVCQPRILYLGLGDLLRGVGQCTLTNSTQEVAEAQIENAGLTDRFEKILSADTAKRLKPAPAPYRMAARALEIPERRMRLVAAHAWDVAGAMRAGCAAAFVARQPFDPLVERPDVVGADLAEVADGIIAAED